MKSPEVPSLITVILVAALSAALAGTDYVNCGTPTVLQRAVRIEVSPSPKMNPDATTTIKWSCCIGLLRSHAY